MEGGQILLRLGCRSSWRNTTRRRNHKKLILDMMPATSCLSADGDGGGDGDRERDERKPVE